MKINLDVIKDVNNISLTGYVKYDLYNSKQIHKMKVLCIGDPHFKEDNLRITELLIKEIIRIIDDLLSVQNEDEKLKLVVVLGDILDRHEKAHITVHTLAMKFLRSIQDKVPLVLLIGNHDRANNSVFCTDESFFWSLKWWNNTYLIDAPTSLSFDGIDFVFCPYVYPGRFLESLKLVGENWKLSTAIFAHQEMYGCKLGIKKSIIGDHWDSDYPLLISGHIHEHSFVNENVIYVGSPQDNTRKTISLFDFGQKNEMLKIKDVNELRIDLNVPKKHTLTLTLNEIIKNNDFMKLTDDLTGLLKIVVCGTMSEMKHGIKHPILNHLRSLGVKIIPKIIHEGKSELPISVKNNVSIIDRIRDNLKSYPHLVKIFESLNL